MQEVLHSSGGKTVYERKTVGGRTNVVWKVHNYVPNDSTPVLSQELVYGAKDRLVDVVTKRPGVPVSQRTYTHNARGEIIGVQEDGVATESYAFNANSERPKGMVGFSIKAIPFSNTTTKAISSFRRRTTWPPVRNSGREKGVRNVSGTNGTVADF